MTVLSTVISVIGTLPVVAAAWYWLQRFQRGRHFLQFTSARPIDLVLTTSAVNEAIHGLPASRPLTGYGQVRAVASCAGVLASLYPRKDVLIHLSGFIRNRLDRDLVILGGPAKNEAARAMLEDLALQHDITDFVFDDINDKLKIELRNRQPFSIDSFAPQISNGYPAKDYGLIVASFHRGQGGKHYRRILCAGFTTYGTFVAAEYLFGDLIKMSGRRLAKSMGAGRIKRRFCFVAVVSARFSQGECIEIQPIYQADLKMLP
ncbi:hypothetical protein ACOB87_16815 [Streptomyces sp. YS-B37]|uniref:hypothetical protein n=1 Tax=unclassified Streptomyces TaxID=2593676 RepID=UPI0038263AF2